MSEKKKRSFIQLNFKLKSYLTKKNKIISSMSKKYFFLFFTLIFTFISSFLVFLVSTKEQKKQNASFPTLLPEKQKWSFSGPFGLYDKAQLQRGFQVYREVCSLCHSLRFVAFRDLEALGYKKPEIKIFAREFEITDGPNYKGDVFKRRARPSDFFPSPYKNEQHAAYLNNGVIPGDLSLVARSRIVKRPFPGFITDIFTNYTTAGPDYIYALLTGYRDVPNNKKEQNRIYWYNPYFLSANDLAMPQPLYDSMVNYADGSSTTQEQYARDVSAFLMWTADPHMEIRKKYGFRIIVFISVFAILAYCLQKKIWADFKTLKNRRQDHK